MAKGHGDPGYTRSIEGSRELKRRFSGQRLIDWFCALTCE